VRPVDQKGIVSDAYEERLARAPADRVTELLTALRCARLAYGLSDDPAKWEAWFYERQMIWREAETLGLTDEMLRRAGEVSE
jgi:hypothetical protein